MKFLSLLLSFVMAFTALPMSSLVDRKPNTQTKTESVIENDGVTLEGGGGIGGLLTESIQQSQQNEAAKDEEENVSIENKILDVVMADNIATVSFNNDKICKIIVAVFDEEGKEMLAHGMVENIEKYAETAYVTIDNGTIPQYYLLRAFLLDENNVALHKSFETNYYTKAHQEFLAKTTDDFEGQEILNLDEDKTNNFAVYNDSVIHITENGENTLLSADDDTLTYVFENVNGEVENLKTGDIVNYNSGDTSLIFKVKTITFDGIKVTVTGDEELTLDEVFKFVKIDTEYTGEKTEMDMSESSEGVEFEGFSGGASTYGRLSGSKSLNFSFKIKDKITSPAGISGFAEGTLDFSATASFAISLYKGGIEVEFSYDQTVYENISVGIDVKLKEISLGKIPIPLGTTGLSIVNNLKFVVMAEGKITYSKEERSNIDFVYDTKYGFQNRSKYYDNPPVEKNMKGAFFLGVKDFLSLDVLNTIAFGIEGTFGWKFTGMDTHPENDKYHNCSICYSINVDRVLKVDAKVELKFLWKFSANVTLFDMTKNVGMFYDSFEAGFGAGTCPNIKKNLNSSKNEELQIGNSVGNIVNKNESILSYGLCGNNLFWTLYGNGTLVISGIGDMVNFSSYTSPPWYSNSSYIKKIIITDGVTSIGDYAFYRNSNLTSVIIGDNVTTIGREAFFWCSNLKNVTIGKSVTNIGTYAFYLCSKVVSINIENSVATIGNGAFYKCYALTSVTIGKNVISIGNYAFMDCYNLASIYFDGNEKQWNEILIGFNNEPLLNAKLHYNSIGPTVYASANVKTLPVRKYKVSKMLAENVIVIEPASNTEIKDDLVAGAVYTLIIIKGTQYDYELTNDSLLYITDAIADENGVATFTHYYNETDISWVAVIYGECNHHASDWITIAEPTPTEKGLKVQNCTKCAKTLTNEEIDIIPEKIVIESLPEKLTYSYGDTLDLTGLTVKYTYTDGRENVSLSESDYTVYGFDAYAFGVQTIIIESGIYKARFDITVDLTVLPESFTDKIAAGTTVESLAELYPNATVYALTADGKKTAGSDEILKTGMILQIIQSDGTVNSVTVIVKGDATGDGIVNGKDIIRVKKQITQGNAVEHIEYADINSDGVVNEDDITALMSF